MQIQTADPLSAPNPLVPESRRQPRPLHREATASDHQFPMADGPGLPSVDANAPDWDADQWACRNQPHRNQPRQDLSLPIDSSSWRANLSISPAVLKGQKLARSDDAMPSC